MYTETSSENQNNELRKRKRSNNIFAIKQDMAYYLSWICMIPICKPVMCVITGPTHLTISVGETAHFRWNNTNDNPTLIYATWGIKKGNIADPQFINVDITSSKVHLNSDLEPNLIKRLSFDGDLRKGLAWFTLKNITVNDTNEYIASISEDVDRVLHRTIALTVKERKKEEQNMTDVTTKDTVTKQVVPSTFPRISKTPKTNETDNAPNVIPKKQHKEYSSPECYSKDDLNMLKLTAWPSSGDINDRETMLNAISAGRIKPEEPVLSDLEKTVISTFISLGAVSLLTIVILFAKRMLLRKENRNKPPSEGKLMECKA